jgi:hypothetical protein
MENLRLCKNGGKSTQGQTFLKNANKIACSALAQIKLSIKIALS